MVLAPSYRMRTLATRWLTDTVTVQSQTVTSPTRAQMAAGTLTLGTARTVRALCRQETVDVVEGVTVRRDVRMIRMWIGDEQVVAGERVNFTACADATMNGRYGTIESVDRDDIRAVRRLTVRLGNDG